MLVALAKVVDWTDVAVAAVTLARRAALFSDGKVPWLALAVEVLVVAVAVGLGVWSTEYGRCVVDVSGAIVVFWADFACQLVVVVEDIAVKPWIAVAVVAQMRPSWRV